VPIGVTETIECSQLIWQRGTFDVKDLQNNTLGAFLGGAAVVVR
jgi:glycopeptide antibiotics resistance protein